MGLASPNLGCVGALKCGCSSLPFCGVLWGELDAILALMLASGCLCDDVPAPVEVSAGLRSETMVTAMLVRCGGCVSFVSREVSQLRRQINIRSLVAPAIQNTPRVAARRAACRVPPREHMSPFT